jgi:hypothetical protein
LVVFVANTAFNGDAAGLVTPKSDDAAATEKDTALKFGRYVVLRKDLLTIL